MLSDLPWNAWEKRLRLQNPQDLDVVLTRLREAKRKIQGAIQKDDPDALVAAMDEIEGFMDARMS